MGSREAPGGTLAPARAANSPSEGLVHLALLLALGTLPGAAQQGSIWTPVAYLVLGTVYLASRSLATLWIVTFAASLAERLPLREAWQDQTFVQLASISALLSGHGIYSSDNAMGMSWSIYLPMGDLLAALPIWFLGAQFFQFFQVFVPLVASLPFAVSPSALTFRLFLGVGCFLPLVGTTARASALELSAIVMFAGYWLLLRRRLLPLAAALLAYGALLRQPLLFTVPFVALALFRLAERRAIATYGGVLVFGGLFHVLRNPLGFADATIAVWTHFADQWFEELGAAGNYSIATVLAALGDRGAFEPSRQPLYLAALAVATAALGWVAWKRRSTESAVVCAIVAVLLVHVLNRGFVLFQYLMASALPALALVGRKEDATPLWRRASVPPTGRVLGAAVGGVVGLLVATPLALALFGELRSWRPPRGEAAKIVALWNGDRPLPLVLGKPPFERWVPLRADQPLRLELLDPVVPRELVLHGAALRKLPVGQVEMIFPTPGHVAGFLHGGRVEGSLHGGSWFPIAEFHSPVHPSVHPRRIFLDAGGRAVSQVRVVEAATFWGQDSWRLGGVELRGDRAVDAPPASAAAAGPGRE